MPKILPDVRESILQTTREMIAEKGYNQISIRDIAKKCGIAAGTFYNYFRSKQEIVSSLLSLDWEKVTWLIKKHMHSDKEPVDRLEEMYRDLKQMMQSVHGIWSEGYPDDMQGETMNKLQMIKNDLHIQFSQFIREVIKGHTEEGREDFTADLIARIFFSYTYNNQFGFEPIRWIIGKLLV